MTADNSRENIMTKFNLWLGIPASLITIANGIYYLYVETPLKSTTEVNQNLLIWNNLNWITRILLSTFLEIALASVIGYFSLLTHYWFRKREQSILQFMITVTLCYISAVLSIFNIKTILFNNLIIDNFSSWFVFTILCAAAYVLNVSLLAYHSKRHFDDNYDGGVGTLVIYLLITFFLVYIDHTLVPHIVSK
mgnify:CR=1 FL=1